MNKLLFITFCILSTTFNQNISPEITHYNRTYTLNLYEDELEEAALQINSDNTVVVNSTNIDNNIMVVFYEGKLKVYYVHPPMETLIEIQEFFNDFKENDIPQFYSDLTDPIFHTPAIKLNECHYFNTKNCLINAQESIDIQDSLIESPHILLKSREIEIEFLLDSTKSIELQSNNNNSALSSIKFILKDDAFFEFQPFITGTVDFDYNFVALMCTHANKVELQFLPGSFYLNENAIHFN